MSGLSVCFPLARFETGGLERVQMHVAFGLVNLGFHVELVTRWVDSTAGTLLRPEVQVHSLGGGRLGFLYRLARWLRRTDPDVIVTSANDIGCFALMLRWLLWRDSKIIWVQHLSVSGPLRSAKGMRRMRLSFEIWLMRRLIQHADAVVAVSISVADDMKRLISPDLSVQVIYNPVISSDFEQRCRERVDWPWPDKEVSTVVFVGRLAPVKRLDLLLQAFSRCIQVMPIRLLVLGYGSQEEVARELSRELRLGDACRFLGYCENPLPWIRCADLLVLCSDSEGFGLVLVEAMGCGTQVVSTDCPDGPSEVLNDGQFGRLVPMGDAEALASAIQASLTSPVARQDDLKKRAAEFSVERAVAKYVELLVAVERA